MRIDRETKNTLDLLLASPPDGPRKSYSYAYLCQLLQLDEDDMFPIVKNLVEQGLAEYAYSVSASRRRDVGIALKYEGLKYREFKRIAAKERWLERLYGFLTGVAATVLTSLIAKWLQG